MYDSFHTESGGSNGSIRVPVVPEFQNDETLPADDYGTFSESCSPHRLPILYHLFRNIWQGTVSDNSTAEYKTIHYMPHFQQIWYSSMTKQVGSHSNGSDLYLGGA